MTGLRPPTGDTPVYVATAHRPAGDGSTGCGRSTGTGLTELAAVAVERWAVEWCATCWTPGAGVDTAIEPGQVWRDKDVAARRLRVTQVTAEHVEAQVTYSSAPDAWDHAAQTTRVQRRHWRRRFTRERSGGEAR